MLSDLPVRLLGWRATVLQGDPSIYDRWRWLAPRLRTGPLRTLDAGSGSGAFALNAARLGNEVVGVSFDRAANETAERRAELLGIEGASFMEGDLRRLDELGLEPFDQVVCFETIEHIRDDAKLVRDLGSLLRPGGTIFLTTPYDEHRPYYGESVSPEEDGGHVRVGYSHARLTKLFGEAGIETVETAYVSGFVSQKLTNLYMRLAGLLRSTHLAWALTLPLRPLRALDRWASERLGYPYLSVGIVGRKR